MLSKRVIDRRETVLKKTKLKNKKGVALLIVLLVTALLVALIFEFAYATRISLNSAVNFRDSQRAYFLARSGIYAFIKYPDLKTNIPQDEWGVVPLISEGDTLVRIKWEDELGKIKVSRIRNNESTNPSFAWMSELFSNVQIDQGILSTIAVNNLTFLLPTELHQVMNDEDFAKVARFVTTVPAPLATTYQININTAPQEVLEAIGIKQADTIVAQRQRQQLTKSNASIYMDAPTYNNLASYLTDTSTYFKVYSFATVGGYTKQIEAIVNTSGNGNILYWRAL